METAASFSYLVCYHYIDNGKLATRLYDKRDDFNFPNANFPFLSSNIPSAPEYGVYVSHITKTRLYNFDPLKPHFYIVKLGFTGVYIIFLISAQNIDCAYPLEPPRRAEI